VQDELVELDEAWRDEDQAAVAHELGDVLLAACNLARHLAVDPSRALHDAASRFERRFRTLEARAHGEGFALTDLSMEELEQRWQRAKRTLSKQGGGA
jgi:ATP diphosphatase